MAAMVAQDSPAAQSSTTMTSTLSVGRARRHGAFLHRAALAVDDVLDGAARGAAEPDRDHVLELDAGAARGLDRVRQQHRVVEDAVDAEPARVEVAGAGGELERGEAVLAVVGPAVLRGHVVGDRG